MQPGRAVGVWAACVFPIHRVAPADPPRPGLFLCRLQFWGSLPRPAQGRSALSSRVNGRSQRTNPVPRSSSGSACRSSALPRATGQARTLTESDRDHQPGRRVVLPRRGGQRDEAGGQRARHHQRALHARPHAVRPGVRPRADGLRRGSSRRLPRPHHQQNRQFHRLFASTNE